LDISLTQNGLKNGKGMLDIDQNIKIIDINVIKFQMRNLDKLTILIYYNQNLQIFYTIKKIKMIHKIFQLKKNTDKDLILDVLIHQDGNFFIIFMEDYKYKEKDINIHNILFIINLIVNINNLK